MSIFAQEQQLLFSHAHSPFSRRARESQTATLAEAQARAEAGDYVAATDFIRQARERDPENIYILAFEKQVEQLTLLSANNALTEESRVDILESLGGIVERVSSVSRQSPERLMPPHRPPHRLRPEEDRAAAMEWLKSQYFQQAHQYVRKGEYEHALAEIRRVYVIEPVNETARQFESHILELKELHGLVPHEDATSVPTPKAPPPAPRTPSKSPSITETAQAEEEPLTKRRRSGTLIVGVIAIAMAFIGFALIYNWIRSNEVKQEPPPVVIPQPEVYFGDPVTVPDTGKASGIERAPPMSRERPTQQSGLRSRQSHRMRARRSNRSSPPPDDDAQAARVESCRTFRPSSNVSPCPRANRRGTFSPLGWHSIAMGPLGILPHVRTSPRWSPRHATAWRILRGPPAPFHAPVKPADGIWFAPLNAERIPESHPLPGRAAPSMSLRKVDKLVREEKYEQALKVLLEVRASQPNNPYLPAYEERLRSAIEVRSRVARRAQERKPTHWADRSPVSPASSPRSKSNSRQSPGLSGLRLPEG